MAPRAPGAPAPTTTSKAEGGDSAPAGLLPSLALPRGGGAIRGMGEKFAANPVTGTGSFTVPIAVSPGRSGFAPQLTLSYDSGSGNGPFGWGFSLSLPAITRKTDKGLPKYDDTAESDIFVLSGAEDLVPVLVGDARHQETRTLADGTTYRVQRYRPRIEGLFARIERWTDTSTGMAHWRSISKENITTFYGRTAAARIADPADPARVFSWLIEESHDDKGNVISYEYKPEDAAGVDRMAPEEQHRLAPGVGFANRHIKRVKYGNRVPFQRDGWLFEVVFDYGEHDDAAPGPAEERAWPVRPDAFSTYRGGFEVRTYRRCRRALMFHRFDELGPEPCLVRSTDLEFADSPVASFVKSATQSGYVREADGQGYRMRSLPPVELTYS
ncbi:MAG TPA: SpvB/TcaC N-terminal domain-containing protein, partial [Haliangium sp.]|nr:SpvB/TcaC N-terminal domain-containing protein [Haliangium sp.]